jgi:hypothetical protein
LVKDERARANEKWLVAVEEWEKKEEVRKEINFDPLTDRLEPVEVGQLHRFDRLLASYR